MNIKLNFRNIELLGLSKARVYKVSGFNRNPQSNKIDIRFRIPRIVISGPYKTIGRILVLPITGEGIANMTLTDADITLRYITKSEDRSGKKFMKIDKSKANIETSR